MGIVNVNVVDETGKVVATGKKPAEKKAAAKKTTAAKKSSAKAAEALAQECLDGLWGSRGRDQDNRLREAGHDVEAVRQAVNKLLGQAAVDAQTDLQRAQVASHKGSS